MRSVNLDIEPDEDTDNKKIYQAPFYGSVYRMGHGMMKINITWWDCESQIFISRKHLKVKKNRNIATKNEQKSLTGINTKEKELSYEKNENNAGR